jgi:hypothetical protein
MSKKTIVKVPFQGRSSSFEIPPPCPYCGKPAPDGTSPQSIELKYELLRLGRGRKSGAVQLGNVRDKDGKKMKGTVSLWGHYCAEHTGTPKPVEIIRKIMQVIAITLGVITGLYFLIATPGDEGFIVYLFLAPLMGGSVYIIIQETLGAAVVWLVARILPSLRDFPLRHGHFGVQCSVSSKGVVKKIDTLALDFDPKIGEQAVQYNLKIKFTNPECAQRFVEAYPKAEIV